MEYTNSELLDLVERYKAESGIPISNDIKLGFAVFARWLLSQKLQQCIVKRRFSLEEFIWSKAFPTEPYNADDYYDWARENATYALNLAYQYCSENGV